MSDYVGVMLIVIFLRVCLVDYNYAKQLKENKVAQLGDQKARSQIGSLALKITTEGKS